jgi:hypothetical protein
MQKERIFSEYAPGGRTLSLVCMCHTSLTFITSDISTALSAPTDLEQTKRKGKPPTEGQVDGDFAMKV